MFGPGQPPLTPYPGYPMYGPQAGFGGAFQNVAGRTPMFGADPGPQYRSPFNPGTGTMLDPLMQIAGPYAVQSLFGQGAMPLQFLPSQSFYEQLKATQFYQMNQLAQQQGARRDVGTVQQLLGGAQMMATGQPLTPAAQARNLAMAESFTGMVPMLSQIFGPDLIDRLGGSKGFSSIMAQQLHLGLRGVRDPISGITGYTGQSAGLMSDTLYERIMSTPESHARFKNMSAGQIGLMVQSMQARGLLGNSSAGLSLGEQISSLPTALTDADVARLAMRHAGPGGDMDTASQQIRESFAAIRRGGLSRDQIGDLAGGNDILRLADVQRIQGRIQDMSGAVKAMQEILGPDGTMEEVFNSLDAMTNGGLATMGPGQVELTVRRMSAMAQNTGIGIQGMMGLMAQNAEIGRSMGLSSQAAVNATLQGAAYGAASGEIFNMTGQFGALSQEQVTLRDMQLRMAAAGSPLSRNIGTLMRMVEEGGVDVQKGTELEAIVSAIRNQETTYEFGGRSRTLREIMDQGLPELLERDAGIAQAMTHQMLLDTWGSQKFEEEFGRELARRSQPFEVAGNLGTSFGMGLETALRGGDSAALIRQLGGEGQFRRVLDRVGRGLAEDVLTSNLTDEDSLRQVMAEQARSRLLNELIASGMNAGQAGAIVDQALPNMELAGSILEGAGNRGAEGFNVHSLTALRQLFNTDVMAGGAGRMQEATVAAYLGSVTAGIGDRGLMARFSDLLQGADENTTMQDALGQLLNVVNLDDLAANQPHSGAGDLLRMMTTTANDPELFQSMMPAMMGLIEGGAAAQTALDALSGKRPAWATDQLMDNLRKAVEGDTVASIIASTGGLSEDTVEALQDRAAGDAAAAAMPDAVLGGGAGSIIGMLAGGPTGALGGAAGSILQIKLTSGKLTIHEDDTATIDGAGTITDHAAAQGI